MANPTVYMIGGAVGYAVLTWIYRRVFDATAGHVDALAKENRALSDMARALRVENEQLRAIVVENGLTPPVRPSIPNEDTIRDLLMKGQKINAIKLYRESTSVGLKEAKDAVEAMEVGRTIASTPTVISRNNLEDRIADLVRAGNKIAAIRDYREATGVDLRTAKDHVEALARELGR